MSLKIKKVIGAFLACLILGSCKTTAISVKPIPFPLPSNLKKLDCGSLWERIEIKEDEERYLSIRQDKNPQNNRNSDRLARVKGEVLSLTERAEIDC